jgi:hypothetical protein
MSSSLLVVEVHRGVRETTLEIFHLAVIEALLTLPNPSFILCFRKPALVFSQVLGRGERSLAHLLRRHCGVMQDKTHQTADCDTPWHPLPPISHPSLALALPPSLRLNPCPPPTYRCLGVRSAAWRTCCGGTAVSCRTRPTRLLTGGSGPYPNSCRPMPGLTCTGCRTWLE